MPRLMVGDDSTALPRALILATTPSGVEIEFVRCLGHVSLSSWSSRVAGESVWRSRFARPVRAVHW